MRPFESPARLGFPGRGRRWRQVSIRRVSPPARGGVLGRDTELARIGAWLRLDTSDDRPEPALGQSMLVIDGEPGIGKTTLWAEAVRLAHDEGWQVLSCRPAASDAGLP